MLRLHNACGIFRKFSWSALFIHETFSVYKLETFKNCNEVKHIMIMIIVIIYIFFILYDIWSTVENYFQNILKPPPPPL